MCIRDRYFFSRRSAVPPGLVLFYDAHQAHGVAADSAFRSECRADRDVVVGHCHLLRYQSTVGRGGPVVEVAAYLFYLALATIIAIVPSGKGQEEAALLGDGFHPENLALIAALQVGIEGSFAESRTIRCGEERACSRFCHSIGEYHDSSLVHISLHGTVAVEVEEREGEGRRVVVRKFASVEQVLPIAQAGGY